MSNQVIVMSLEDAERVAGELADSIIERFENNDPSAYDRLVDQSMVILMENYNVVPSRPALREPRSQSRNREHAY